jgi:hypothetical protein
MSESRSSQRQVRTYLLLVFLYSSVFYFLILHAHKLTAGRRVGRVFSPQSHRDTENPKTNLFLCVSVTLW